MFVMMFQKGRRVIEVPCSTTNDCICTEIEFYQHEWECCGIEELRGDAATAYLQRFGGGVHIVAA